MVLCKSQEVSQNFKIRDLHQSRRVIGRTDTLPASFSLASANRGSVVGTTEDDVVFSTDQTLTSINGASSRFKIPRRLDFRITATVVVTTDAGWPWFLSWDDIIAGSGESDCSDGCDDGVFGDGLNRILSRGKVRI